jgi:CRAL/TRIO domain
MEKSKDLFESYMLLKHSVPRWCDFNDETLSRLWVLYETGVVYPLQERDSEGRKIIFVQPRRCDPKLFTFADGVLLITWIAKAILEEEETQIAGLITIIDHSELTFAHVRMASVSDAIDFVSVVKNGVVGRLKGMYHVALPSFASFMLEVGKKTATEKLRKRIHVVDDMESLKAIIDPALLPLEHGGTIPEADMMRTFKKFADTNESTLRSIQDNVDWERVALEGQSSCSLM